jgi:hypothetical protein
MLELQYFNCQFYNNNNVHFVDDVLYNYQVMHAHELTLNTKEGLLRRCEGKRPL